jgi:hypothetical protein
MNSADDILWAFPVLVGCLNVLASVRLYRANELTRTQKSVQGVLVWAVPLLGALLVLAILNMSDREVVPRRLRSQIDGDGFNNADGPFYGPGQAHSGHDAGGHDPGAGDGH